MLLRALMLAGVLLALPPTPDLKLVESLIDPSAASQADTLDIVYSGGLISHVAYESSLSPPTATLPSPIPTLTITPRPVRYGTINGDARGYLRADGQAGGFVVDLGSAGRVRSLLSYTTITVAGTWNGTWQVSLADEDQASRGASAHLGFLDGRDAVSFPLNQAIAAKTDLSRARYLFFSLASPQGQLDLRTVTCIRSEISLPPTHTAVWIFNPQKLQRSGSSVAEELAAKGIKRAYVQVDDDPGQLYPFLRAATKMGIEVFAREGSPESLQHGSPLLSRVAAVIAYNRQYSEAPFAGLQLDIAPHGLRDFGIRRQYYADRYITLLNDVAGQCRSVIPLSVIVPDWFARIPAHGLNLTAKTLALADELVVTCNRTSFAELVQCANDSLLWGERFNKPVFIGIKTGPVPDEGHVVLRKGTKKKGTESMQLAGMPWEQEKSYSILAAQTTFNGKPAELAALLALAPANPSFGGWVIDSYETLR